MLDLSDNIPERVGRYRITKELGSGGMGIVYAALDERLDRSVAIKMIRRAASHPRARERMWREARAAAAVNHPNICQLYEIAEEEGEVFIAMELLEGESLAARIARQSMTVTEAFPIMLAMLSALEAIHRRGLVHRDLKPSNVFLTPHGVKLLDFGLARPAEEPEAGENLTQSGTLLGTPRYLAPEQLRGGPVDGRADLFASGAVLFEMLSGKPAFDGNSVAQVLQAIVNDQPPLLGGSAAIVAVDRIIHRALEKNPARRYPSAEAMADDLRAAMALADTGEMERPHAVTRLIVLPFRIMRSDPETDFLAFSLPDAITSSLSGLESLVVRSSLAAARFAGEAPDLAAIARQAEVDFVLTGTLLRAGDQLRVVAQLMETPAGTLVWSDTVQVPLGDIFQLQDTLTQRLVESLSLPLSARDRGMLRHDVPASAKAYEFYLRANQLSHQSSQWKVARDLYLQCLDEDPRYAPAWARLGRIYRVIGAYSGEDPDEKLRRSEEAFKRALELNPDLPIAHNLYTYLEVEMGDAQPAMLRLLRRAEQHGADPELFAGLVQACRYCGLLEASVAAYEQAHRLDPEIRTSVSHAYMMLGDYERSIATNVEDPPSMNAVALELMGRADEAIVLLREHEKLRLPKVAHDFNLAHRALLEGDPATSLLATERMLESWQLRDPCGRYYVARLLARLGERERALAFLRQATEGGFICYSFMTRDPWLDGLRREPEFRDILRLGESRQKEALAAFLHAGGDRILGASLLDRRDHQRV
jgi:serine/threonine protein kinase